VPANEISLSDEAEFYGNDPKKIARITKMIGLDKRRVAPEGVTASDLCVQAAQRLFDSLHVDKSTVDALIFVTQSPDYPVPATAFIQQDALGLPTACAAFDVNLGCAGYVYGLWLAGCLLESRAVSRVLLLAGDAYFGYLPKANRVVTPLFGDAGSATLLEYSATPLPVPFSFSIGSDGSGHEALIRPGGGARIPDQPFADYAQKYNEVVRDANGTPWSVGGFGNTYMDGMAIFDFTMNVIPAHIKDHMTRVGYTPERIDRLVLHQANKQVVRNIAEATGFEDAKAPWQTISKYGNQTVASIPGAICDQLKDECAAGTPLTLMLCGYGIGLTWASCLGTFTGLYCDGIHDYIPPARIPGPAEKIEYWHRKFKGQ
jgi:3-oxoacyl-[acyl-carrier-protein] synthase III